MEALTTTTSNRPSLGCAFAKEATPCPRARPRARDLLTCHPMPSAVLLLQMPAVAFWGEPLVPIFPRRDAHCLSYVAPPLLLPTIAEPTAAQVDEWHAKYLAALQKLFDDSKAEVGEPTATLEIF